jgi:hypothetical protein
LCKKVIIVVAHEFNSIKYVALVLA